MGAVIRLADNGISPGLVTAVDSMQAGIWEVIDQAAEKGVPIGLIIGQLEVIKASMIEAHFRNNSGE